MNFNHPKKKKKNPPNTKQRGHAQSVRLGLELEVTVVVSTLYSLITNLVNGGFAVGINGDAILMMFVRVGQVFLFWLRRKECGLQPQHRHVSDGAHHHHRR